MTMAEYIRREDAIKCIEGQCVDGKMWGNDESEGTLIEAYSAIDDLMEIPPADVAPVRHARWVSLRKGDWTSVYKCSLCKRRVTVACDRYKADELVAASYPYCHCGAKMDGDTP